jgi:dihydroorotase
MAESWILQGGLICDGSGEPPFRGDVRIRDNVIAEVSRSESGQLADSDASEVIDARDFIVTPGLIDLHTHVYDGMNMHSVAPAQAGLRTGVTSVLDMGSAGAMNYGTFRQYVMPHSAETIYALLNISWFGVQGHPEIPPYIGDLHNELHLDVPAAMHCIEQHRDTIVGIKARLTSSLAGDKPQNERAALKAALEVRDLAQIPCYIHHVSSSIPLAELLGQLTSGDVLTHFYHGIGDGGFTANDGGPGDTLLDARERGVIFDVGHGSGCFAWRIAEPACQTFNFWPDTISSDIHKFNIETPVVDLPTTMSKFLHLGMPLEKVIQCSTLNPASAMGQQDYIGLLEVGRLADISLLELEDGEHELVDSEGAVRRARQRIMPVGVFKNGRFSPCDVDYSSFPEK